MASEQMGPDGKPLTGISKIFNSYTNTGRKNVTLATYGACVAVGLFLWLKPKKAPAAAQK